MGISFPVATKRTEAAGLEILDESDCFDLLNKKNSYNGRKPRKLEHL
jgi:hypothetical protein